MEAALDHRDLLEPFIEATRTALAELAGIEVAVVATGETARAAQADDVSAVVHLTSAQASYLVLIFPRPTASALAQRVLAEATSELDPSLMCDCLGEVANVVCGQAKSLLAGTPHRFTFDVPTTLVGAIPASVVNKAGDRCVASFRTDVGPFTMRLMW